MLIERRIYTLLPGKRQAFMQAQIDRGFELIAPIAQRLIGYFVNEQADGDRIVHLYRYDSLQDWQQRLHGLYGVAALEPYFTSVRAVMQRQDNDFFLPAAHAVLTPCWGNGRDWLPQQGPFIESRRSSKLEMVQDTFCLRPGALPAFMAQAAQMTASAGGLLGWMSSLSGRQHRAIRYSVTTEDRESCSPSIAELLPCVAAFVTEHDTARLAPVLDIAPMSPMFFNA